MIPICPYCKSESRLVDSAVVYGKSYGPIYLCQPCEAWVGVHKGTPRPLGSLANSETRAWRKKAHAAFDPLWKWKYDRRINIESYKKKFANRNRAYLWLSEKIKVKELQCHIALFDVELCKKTVEVCQKLKITP